ncbi:hypothetical protein ABZ897_30810 [Nonomuraea sp. NPDC046802]|uniref:hypothetical protein n=1 Tax=Nonomuraea sp. NPDC046802 TaxID=3154919 RepID=UPI0033C777C5
MLDLIPSLRADDFNGRAGHTFRALWLAATSVDVERGDPAGRDVAQSVADMEKVARMVVSEDETAEKPQKIGLYVFDHVYRVGDRAYSKLGDNSSVDPYGYVWSPKGTPTDDDSNEAVTSSFEHVQGPWYWWSDSY